jgi:hypothetical protein
MSEAKSGNGHDACPGFRFAHPGYGIRFSNSHVVRRHSFAISPRIHASFAENVLPSKESEGAGNAGRLMRPQPRMQNKMSIRA